MEINDKEFFFGRAYDLQSKQADPEKPVFYDPADLTTHGVITGMTGSGKTGMGIVLLEEAALQGIPAILIDPKGDLTNHLLHFPDLLPADFAAWVDEDTARRDGKTAQQAGEEAAASWQKGLADWGIDKARIERLANAVDYAVYTPGSDSAIPVSILSSLKAPAVSWEENKEMLRENISSSNPFRGIIRCYAYTVFFEKRVICGIIQRHPVFVQHVHIKPETAFIPF